MTAPVTPAAAEARDRLIEATAEALFDLDEVKRASPEDRVPWADWVAYLLDHCAKFPKSRHSGELAAYRARAATIVDGPLATALAESTARTDEAVRERDEARALIEAATASADGMDRAAKWMDPDGGLKSAIMGFGAAARNATRDDRGTQFVLSHLVRTLRLLDADTARIAALEAEVKGLQGTLEAIDDWATEWCQGRAWRSTGSAEAMEGYQRGALHVAGDLRRMIRERDPEIDNRVSSRAALQPNPGGSDAKA